MPKGQPDFLPSTGCHSSEASHNWHSSTNKIVFVSALNILTKQPVTTDISGQFIFLGTGTSVGIPAIGCGCAVCSSSDPRNRRSRCSVALGLPEGNLLIDSGPDLRMQLLRERIGIVHAVLYTHEHADHLFGLDDLRLVPFYLGYPVPLYCEPTVQRRIQKSFDYAFTGNRPSHPGAVPKLTLHTIGTDSFSLLGVEVTPLRLKHGADFEVLGFRFGNIAYCTDTDEIPLETMSRLKGLDVLILDALRPRPHVTHFSLDEAVEVAHRVGARQTFFTHMSHELEHEATCKCLPDGMDLAYDGLRIPLT